jgi:hypothetical protein
MKTTAKTTFAHPKWIEAFICFACLLFFPGKIFCQVRFRVNINIKADTISVPEYEAKHLEFEKQVTFKMNFNEYKIENAEDANVLSGATIMRVDLIYTNYPEKADFTLLNKRRILELYLLSPEIFGDPETQYRFVSQTKCKTIQEASKMFHGFVITYRSAPTVASSELESSYLKSVVTGKTPIYDSTIFKVLGRHKNWHNMLVVADFTGSMSPYESQVLLWQALNITNKAIKNFVFFNDGDMTPDNKKVIGKTGGIYCCTADNLDTIIKTATITMRNGTGGDSPENDIEAILYGIKKYPDCDEVILIADNLSNMRDYCLLSKIKKPIKVILCGTYYGINCQYINLAYQTKGSVHTIEQDIENLIKLKDGEKFKVGKKNFKVSGGEVIALD